MNKSIKKVLITSSSDMLFSSFIRAAIYEKQPYKFISIDNMTKHNLTNYYINKDHPFYYGDTSDVNFLDVIFEIEKPDIVIHGSVESNDKHILNNITSTQTIIDASLKYGVEKIIFVSNDKVYGSLEDDTEKSHLETDPYNPNNLFSASKAAGELLIKAAGIKYNIIRLANCYGARQRKEKLIPKAIQSILNNEKIVLSGQGSKVRDWIYVKDAYLAILTILQSAAPNETYNISSNNEFSVIEVIHKICNVMEKGHELISFIPYPTPKSDFRRGLDNNKLKALGWKPQFKFSDGLKETKDWFQNNQWWYKNNL